MRPAPLQATTATYTPADGQSYYYYNLDRRKVMSTTMKSSHLDQANYFLGNMHETERAAELWGQEAEQMRGQMLIAFRTRSMLDRFGLYFEGPALDRVTKPVVYAHQAWHKLSKRVKRR